MARQKTAVVAQAMFAGGKPYQLHARRPLTHLVRQALAKAPINNLPLAKEHGMPNPRNMNYVLGKALEQLLEQLGREWNSAIPPIQSLAIRNDSRVPGKGFFEGFTKLESPTRQQREATLKEYHAKIYAYPNWLKVLAALGLSKAEPNATEAVENARHLQGGGEGERTEHLRIAYTICHPLWEVRLSQWFESREFPLPSGDRLDVYFEHGRMQLAVEVKPSTSLPDDIARGLFQCVKYESVLNKWRLAEHAGGHSCCVGLGRAAAGVAPGLAERAASGSHRPT